MENIAIIVIVLVIIGLAVLYIYKAKKSGKKCIGCPENGACSSKNCSGSCGCCGADNK